MTILTKSLIELQEERAAKREYDASARPTTQSKKRKWKEIETKKEKMEDERVELNEIEIG